MSQWKEGLKLLHGVAFDSKPPETCIELFEARRFEGPPVFIKLADRIQKADDNWIEEFLGLGGLEKIFETLAALSNKSLVSFAGAVPELECARCIKSIMNHRVGMEHATTTDKKFIHRLAEGLSSDSELMKTEVFQLLSAVCMYSSEGHKLVIDACGLKYARSGYSLLVEELRAAKMDESRAAIVAFINCLLACCKDVEERLKIRHQLAALNYQHLLSTMRDTSNDVLSTQIDVFYEGSALDQKKAEEGINITDHKDVFRAVYAKVAGTPNALSFLHILQHLMLLDRDSKKCNMIWEMLEKIVISAVMISEGNQAAADHFISASTEKIKKALAQVVNDPASNATSLSSSSVASNTETPQASISESSLPPPVPLPTTSPVPPSSSIPPAPPPPASTVPPAPPPPPPTSGLPVPPPPPCPSGSVPAPPPLGNFGTAVTDDTLDPTLKSSFEFHSAKKLHILNWKKLSRNVVQAHKHCLWLQCTSNKSSDIEKINININTEQIVQLFSRKDMSTGVEGRHASHHIVCLLDSKTGLNVSVFLKQFKGGGKDVIGWIQTFGIKNVTVEQMTALEKLLPDTNTIDLLTSHSGNQKLGDAEVFLLQLIKIDKYVLRVEVMKLFLEFKEKKQELQPALQLVCKAIDEILKSKSLKRLLYIILIAGNFLNSGGYSGKAYGFTITSLDNLGDTRANKPHMTFINYIALILQQQCPELLDVGKELPSLKEASRYIVGDITQQIQELNKRFEQFQDKLNQTTDDFKQQAENILTSVRSGLKELMADVKKTSDGKEAMMEFLCEDPLQCKLEEVLQCIMKFVDHLSTCAQENAKQEEVEKKREIRKATAGNAPVSSENVVDKLLHEIRDGTTLRHRC